MKFTKYTFLMLGLASMFSFHHGDAVASVGAGYFQKNAIKTDCRPGCYCEGGSNVTTTVNVKDKCSKHQDPGIGGGVKLCPDDFPKSDANAKKVTDCYYINPSGKKIYSQQHTCSAGYYLPKNSDTCKGCTDVYTVSSGKYCPGISGIYPSKTSDQGIQTCPSGQEPTATLKACVCPYGTYKDGSTCKNCPADFPVSWSGSNKLGDCHITVNGKTYYRSDYMPYRPNSDGRSIGTDSDPRKCDPGTYIPAGKDQCEPCKAGHYCPGWGNNTHIFSQTEDQGIAPCPSGQVPNQNKSACVASTTVTPTTIAPATIAPTTIAPVNIAPIKHCDIGTYLPANSGDCAACTENICAGGTFTVTTYDQGLGQRCVAPEKPNHRTGKCDRDMITCISGTYLPANSPLGTECSPCPKGKLCLGGTFEIMRSIDQGADGTCQGDTIISSSGKECIACEFGKKPNSTHTACVSTGSATVEPGYFLPKGSTESKKCTGTSKYCPGGTFDPSTSRDQGQFDCPTGSRATDDKSACAVTLTKKQMMYGINGTGGRYSENAVQCWTKTGADYKACMGFKSDGSLVSTSVPGLSINLKPIKVEMKPIKAELKLASPLVQAASKDLVTKESPRKD